ncbi:MAG: hypothetical protein ACRDBM_06345, partial [Sporomusa sp.]
STIGVGSTNNIDSPFSAASRYVKMYRDTITLNTTTTASSYIYFNAAGFNKVTLSNKGDSDILQLTGNLNATGTIKGSKVYNAVYNDVADFVPKDPEVSCEPGDIIAKQIGTDNYTKATKATQRNVVGVYSDTYGIVLGGENLDDMEDNKKNFIPIGIAGNVYVKMTGEIAEGDLVTVSHIDGVGIKSENPQSDIGCIIGKALESKDTHGISKIKIQIMLI